MSLNYFLSSSRQCEWEKMKTRRGKLDLSENGRNASFCPNLSKLAK
jgi:hypothetical protein